MPPKPTGHPILRNGFLVGALLALLGVGNVLVQWLTGQFSTLTSMAQGDVTITFEAGPEVVLLSCVIFLTTLGLTFVAGMLAAHRQGSHCRALGPDRGRLWRAGRQWLPPPRPLRAGSAWRTGASGHHTDARTASRAAR
jgi:hypothetical protein